VVSCTMSNVLPCTDVIVLSEVFTLEGREPRYRREHKYVALVAFVKHCRGNILLQSGDAD
jgi:hypothetical protein